MRGQATNHKITKQKGQVYILINPCYIEGEKSK